MVGALRLPTLPNSYVLLCRAGKRSAPATSAHPPCQITPHAFLPLYNFCAFPRHEAFSTSLKNTHIK
ncbi:hypothetical protein CDT94_14460 [Cronobacter sakazakii]|nr:hypothetical protein CDT94_14460 [Cronobacter sakazakii]PUY56670.1 hypothetical protein CEA52_05970 [Cronobacter sakazakii]